MSNEQITTNNSAIELSDEQLDEVAGGSWKRNDYYGGHKREGWGGKKDDYYGGHKRGNWGGKKDDYYGGHKRGYH
jgi:hypothetical protein